MVMRRRGPTPGVFMSGHLRFCFAAFLLLAGFSTSPASANPFAALFSTAPGDATAPPPGDATAPAHAEQECLRQPGRATDGQHWVYRLDGPRKCWFQVAERSATVKKPAHQYAAKQRVVAPEENEAAQRKPKAVVGDARAELLPAAPAETSQPTPSVRVLKVVDADSVSATGAATLVPLAPVVAKPATDQLTPDYPTRRPVDMETPLATAPSASDTVASSAPAATSLAVPIAEAIDEERGWMITWLGVLLMGLGFISLLSSSVTLRGHRAGRAISRSEDKSAANRRTSSVWEEADQRPDNFHVTRRQSVIVGPSPRSGRSYTPRPLEQSSSV